MHSDNNYGAYDPIHSTQREGFKWKYYTNPGLYTSSESQQIFGQLGSRSFLLRMKG